MVKKKEIKLPMRFNPGLQKYEPQLPLKRSNEPINFNWIKFLFILLGIIALGVIFYIIFM